jgi:hypothetical protein
MQTLACLSLMWFVENFNVAEGTSVDSRFLTTEGASLFIRNQENIPDFEVSFIEVKTCIPAFIVALWGLSNIPDYTVPICTSACRKLNDITEPVFVNVKEPRNQFRRGIDSAGICSLAVRFDK